MATPRPAVRRSRLPLWPALRHLVAPLAFALIALPALPARAQTAAPRPSFDVPAGPLGPALNRFAQQAGVAIVVDADKVRGLTSPGLRGSYGVDEGFALLLRGTGYTVGRTAAGYVLVAAPAAPPPVAAPSAPVRAAAPAAPASVTPELPAVRVTALDDDDRAGGFLAKRSSVGTKTDTPLVEVPRSITVITSDQFTEQGIDQGVAQTLRYATGVVSEPRGTMTALDFIYARGFLVNQYLDGMRTLSNGYSLPQPDPFLLERVEVLRGPASMLYGQADPGGVLNLVSKRPTDAPLREVEVIGGSYDRFQGGVDIGGPLDANGQWLGRLTMMARDADSQVDHAREQRFAIAPAIEWRPDRDVSLTLLGNYQNDPHVGFYNWLPAYGTVLENPARPGSQLPTSLDTGEPSFDRYRRETGSFGDILEVRVNDDLKFRQSLRYTHVDSAFDNIYSSYLDADFVTLNRYAWHLRDSIDAVTSDQNVQYTFRTGPATHTLVAGADFQYSRYTQKLGYNFDPGVDPGQVPPIDIFAPVYGHDIPKPDFASDALQKTYQTGLYLQDQVAIGNLRLVAGGRYDWTHSNTVDRMSDFTDQQRASAFTGHAGAVYLFDNGFAPYVSYSESFLPIAGLDFEGNPFKPTEGRQWEAGVKYAPGRGKSFAMLSVYELKERNVLSPDVEHPGQSLQTGEIRSRGVELSGVMNLAEGFNALFAASHVDQEVTKGGVDFGPAAGKTPASIPADTASAWLDYTFTQRPLAGLGIGAGVRYVGSSWGDDDNTFKVPSTTLMDAALRYDLARDAGLGDGWRIALTVSNVFDKVYVSSCGGVDFCAYGQRRTMLARLSRRW